MKKKKKTNEITVSAPGRICLFGEHQDYLGLSVLTAAINRRLIIHGVPNNEEAFNLDMPDIQEKDRIEYKKTTPYRKERDYLQSVVRVLQERRVAWPHGFDCTIHGTIPINSGTSSSSALVVAWTAFLLRAANNPRWHDFFEVATLAHQAEVVEFNEPGGMMDHYAVTFGNVLYIDFEHPGSVEWLKTTMGAFVLGDSKSPKHTTATLSKVKKPMQRIIKVLKDNEYQLKNISLNDVNLFSDLLTKDECRLLRANIRNRDLTQQACELFHQDFDPHEFGALLTEHHNILRDGLKISTAKIDTMIQAALDAGAYGAKINGSGGGGCMFAYCPENPERVVEAVQQAGGYAYVVHVDKGLFVES